MSDDLSRLLDGELDPAEAEALRARIATDPALAARWARMQGLAGRIGALPKEMGVPAGLGPRAARTAGGPGTRPSSAGGRPPERRWRIASQARSALPWLGWAAAAALTVLVLRPAPTRVLVDGTEVVDGRGELLAGDVRVAFDGRARVTVEPPAAGGREVGAEDETMNPSHLLAALAGSVVTVTVTQGAAWLYPDDAPATAVAAGETRSVGGDADGAGDAAAAAGGSRPRATGERGEGARGEGERADADRVAALEREVARLEREKTLARAQARRNDGEPTPWPADAPAAFRPEAFERLVTERVAAIPDAELAALDCEAFPCVAVIESHSDAPDWEERMRGLEEGLDAAGFGDAPQVVGLAFEVRTDEGDAQLYGFAVAPADFEDADRARLRDRAERALRDLTEGGAPAPR